MAGYELKSTIHSNQFMILVMDNDSKDFAVRNRVYGTYAEALHSAQEWAAVNKAFKYIVVAVAAVAEARVAPVIVTTSYKL